MSETTEIRLAGKTLSVPALNIGGSIVIVTGKWLRVGAFKDEELVEMSVAQEAPRIIEELRKSQPRPDIFSFGQKLPDVTPMYKYYFEWESWAAIRTTSVDAWWKGLPQESRKNVRRAEKRGVLVRAAVFDDTLVKGIQAIYDETPIRQGKPFWHFGRDFAATKQAMATYLDRSDFLGAYLNEELVGFIKLTYVDRVATIMQILARNAYQEARPMNALLASAVEHCQRKGLSFLLYGQYVYGRHTKSSLTEFKRRNGFEEVRLPRYFVPLTSKGSLAIKLRLHSPLRDRLPAAVVDMALKVRSFLYHLRMPSSR